MMSYKKCMGLLMLNIYIYALVTFDLISNLMIAGCIKSTLNILQE